MVLSRSSSSAAPVRAKRRRRRSAMRLRTPSSRVSSKSLNSRLSQTFTARKLRSRPGRCGRLRDCSHRRHRARCRRCRSISSRPGAGPSARRAAAQRLQSFSQPSASICLLLVGEVFLGELAQPFLGNVRFDRLLQRLHALEHLGEDLVELVEMALVLHQRRGRQIVELVDPMLGEIGFNASSSVRYSRSVTGTPADFNSWKKVTNMARSVARIERQRNPGTGGMGGPGCRFAPSGLQLRSATSG